MSPEAAPVTAIVVVYGDAEGARPAIESLRGQTTPPAQVLVVDNNEHRSQGFGPDVQVLRPGRNLGYTGGCNMGAEHATQRWLFFLNPDAQAAPDCLERLVAAADERTAIVGAQVLLADGESVNAGDNPVHVTGLSWSGRYSQHREDGPPREAAAVSGAALLARADLFRELGGMCPEFFMYVDDTDLAWRATLGGWRVMFVPRATVRHDYEFDKGASKWLYLERNRLWMVLSNYAPATLALLGPMLLAAELGIALQSRRDGWWPQKLAAWGELWAQRRALVRWRHGVQAGRRVTDAAVVGRMRGDMRTPLVESPLLDRMNPWMERYRRAVLRMLRS